MATGANPILQMLAQRMQGGAAGGPGAPSPGGGETPGTASRELQGGDPGYALKLVTQIKKQTADLIPVLAFRAPGAARALSAVFKNLDAAIKELQRATATAQAVGGPVEMSAIPRPQPPGGSGAPQLVMGNQRGGM